METWRVGSSARGFNVGFGGSGPNGMAVGVFFRPEESNLESMGPLGTLTKKLRNSALR